ncbi:MAG: aminotransferase class I/II-fold pyridoxal phosphate-dependent enzyme, partial [Bacilli bacterium]
LVNRDRVQAVLSMLTTTSTSYLLLASIDAARKQLVTDGKNALEKTIALANRTRKQINNIPGLYCAGEELLNGDSTFSMDPTKLLVSVRNLGVTGYDVELWLREHYNIEVELSDLYNILCIVTSGDDAETVGILIDALSHFAGERYSSDTKFERLELVLPDLPEVALSPREAFYATTVTIPLSEASGRTSAESIMVYPPGIPIVTPGETITEKNIAYIQMCIEKGLPVQGTDDPTIQTIRVVEP